MNWDFILCAFSGFAKNKSLLSSSKSAWEFFFRQLKSSANHKLSLVFIFTTGNDKPKRIDDLEYFTIDFFYCFHLVLDGNKTHILCIALARTNLTHSVNLFKLFLKEFFFGKCHSACSTYIFCIRILFQCTVELILF